MDRIQRTPREALGAWDSSVDITAPIARCQDGLINQTFFIGDPPSHVLQWVNPIFDDRIQRDIAAVTDHLGKSGLVTTRLIPIDGGALSLPDGSGFWRLMTFIPGHTFHRLSSPRMAFAVGELVGRFHSAMATTDIELAAPPRRVHQTPLRLEELRRALEHCDGHPLAGPAREVGAQILEDWASWQGEILDLERLCHGDLKVSNIRFGADDEAISLIDLDTLGPQDFAAEMGDAWRSWCNPATEDQPEAARLDLDLFEASARGWLQSAPPMEMDERDSLVPGIERIALELAARFGADIVANSYFREDRERFPNPGEHNLARARSQLAFARSARRQRAACERLVMGASE